MEPNIFIGLGSNLGEPQYFIQEAIKGIADLPHTEIANVSSLYQTKPVGPKDQNDYINAVVELKSALSPLELLDNLQALEALHGRIRGQRWGARTLDCDILYYNKIIMRHPRLTLPHSEILHRAFVLIPLAEIAPTWKHLGAKCILELANTIIYDHNEVKKLTLDEIVYE